MSRLSNSDFQYISKDKQYVKCVDCEFLTFERQCSNLYDYPTVDKEYGCCNGKDKFRELKEKQNKKKKRKTITLAQVLLTVAGLICFAVGVWQAYLVGGILTAALIIALFCFAIGGLML